MTEHMTPAELHVVREWLGLDLDDLARILGINERTARRWQHGTTPIPDGVREDIERIERVAADMVERAVTALNDARDPLILVYRTDEEFWAAHPGDHPYPARFHRAVVARVAHEVPGLEIDYASSEWVQESH